MRRRRDLRIAQSCTALRTLATRLFAAWPPTRRCVNSSNSPYCALAYGPKRSFRGYHGLRRGTCSTKLAHVHARRNDLPFTCPRFFVSKSQNPSSRTSQGTRFGARELLVRAKSSRAPKIASKMKKHQLASPHMKRQTRTCARPRYQGFKPPLTERAMETSYEDYREAKCALQLHHALIYPHMRHIFCHTRHKPPQSAWRHPAIRPSTGAENPHTA